MKFCIVWECNWIIYHGIEGIQAMYSTTNQRDQPTESTNIKWTHRERQQSTQLRSLSLPWYGHDGAYAPEDTNLDSASSTIRLRLISFAVYSITSPSTPQPSLPMAPSTTIYSCAVVSSYNNSSSTPRPRLVSVRRWRSWFHLFLDDSEAGWVACTTTPKGWSWWWGWCWKGTQSSFTHKDESEAWGVVVGFDNEGDSPRRNDNDVNVEDIVSTTVKLEEEEPPIVIIGWFVDNIIVKDGGEGQLQIHSLGYRIGWVWSVLTLEDIVRYLQRMTMEQ